MVPKEGDSSSPCPNPLLNSAPSSPRVGAAFFCTTASKQDWPCSSTGGREGVGVSPHKPVLPGVPHCTHLKPARSLPDTHSHIRFPGPAV